MEKYNHQVGLKIVGEMLPQERNRVTLADGERPIRAAGRRASPIHWCDNDKRLIAHSLGFMRRALRCRRRTRNLGRDRRYLPSQRHRAHGRRSAKQRGQCRLPLLGYSQSVDLRRLGVPDRRRRQSVADDPGHRLPHGGPDQGDGGLRGVVNVIPGPSAAKSPESISPAPGLRIPDFAAARRSGMTNLHRARRSAPHSTPAAKNNSAPAATTPTRATSPGSISECDDASTVNEPRVRWSDVTG